MAVFRKSKFVLSVIAGISMLTAVAVYGFARTYPPEILVPIAATIDYPSSLTGLFGSAPSFFYTMALGLVIGICASTLSSAIFHCSIWTGLALILELSQHPMIAHSVSSWIRSNSFDSVSRLFEPFWSVGVFDPLDLLATLVGGVIAMYLIICLLPEKDDAPGQQ